MTIQQISVFLENKAGQLAEITALLSEKHIDMRALNIAETADYGILRLITTEPARTAEILLENGFIVSLTPVLGIAIPDRPGGLCRLLKKFAENAIDVEYMYSVIGQKEGTASMIFRVADIQKVEQILAGEGITPLGAAALENA